MSFPKNIKNFKAILEYNGTHYHGWQWQKGRLSLQQVFEEALQKIVKQKIRVIASGRTDAGVHALAQVVSFKLATRHSSQTLQRALNANLPESLVLKEIQEVRDDFHAQRDAKNKRYTYLIWNDPTSSAFLYPYVWQIKKPLDWKAMKKALRFLKGRQDFKSFQSVGTPVKSTVREIFRISIKSPLAPLYQRGVGGIYKNSLYAISIDGNGFLKQMVRNIVGTLVQVGLGQITSTDIPKILKAKDRRKAGPAAPARGLFLVEVKY